MFIITFFTLFALLKKIGKLLNLPAFTLYLLNNWVNDNT